MILLMPNMRWLFIGMFCTGMMTIEGNQWMDGEAAVS